MCLFLHVLSSLISVRPFYSGSRNRLPLTSIGGLIFRLSETSVWVWNKFIVAKSIRMTIERNMIKKKTRCYDDKTSLSGLDTWNSVSAEPSETGASFELSSKVTIRKMVANGKMRLINNYGIKICFLLPSSICIDLSWPTPIMVKTTM